MGKLYRYLWRQTQKKIKQREKKIQNCLLNVEQTRDDAELLYVYIYMNV